MLYAIIAVLVILADQMIKLYVSSDTFHAMELIPGVLNLTKVENTGGAFGLLSGEIPTYWFIVIAAVFTVLVVIALSTRFVSGFLARWSLVLVTAGGVSNCIDRVINVRPVGHVVDMFQFDFWKAFPVFNLADVFITVFCFIFILAILFGRDSKEEDLEDEFVEDEEEELEEEKEEVRPSRKSRKARKAELEEEEEEELSPKAERKSRKARQARYDEEYEQYKAEQRAREEARKAATQPQPAAVVDNPVYNPADPFAEWERANAAQRPAQQPAAPAPAPAPVAPQPAPAPAPVAEAPKPAPKPVRRSELDADPQYAARPAQPARPVQPAAQPAAPAPAAEQPAPAPAPRAARKLAPTPVEEDVSFSLDDILAEFK